MWHVGIKRCKKTWVLCHIFIKFNLFIKYKVGCIEWRVGITTIHTNLIETTPPKIFTWQRNWWKNDLINKNSVVNSNSKPSHILNYDGGGNSTLVSSKQLQSTKWFHWPLHVYNGPFIFIKDKGVIFFFFLRRR